MSLDANDLILFAHIMDAGSFSRAAERTGLPKSTLSRRITALETKFGERLLIRSTRRLVITEFGERILDHARRLLEETEAASAMALNRQGIPRGVLRVSLPPDFAEFDLTPFLIQFAASYPEIHLELDLSPRRVDLLAERFDLAVRVASRLPDDSTLVAAIRRKAGRGSSAASIFINSFWVRSAARPETMPFSALQAARAFWSASGSLRSAILSRLFWMLAVVGASAAVAAKERDRHSPSRAVRRYTRRDIGRLLVDPAETKFRGTILVRVAFLRGI